MCASFDTNFCARVPTSILCRPSKILSTPVCSKILSGFVTAHFICYSSCIFLHYFSVSRQYLQFCFHVVMSFRRVLCEDRAFHTVWNEFLVFTNVHHNGVDFLRGPPNGGNETNHLTIDIFTLIDRTKIELWITGTQCTNYAISDKDYRLYVYTLWVPLKRRD